MHSRVAHRGAGDLQVALGFMTTGVILIGADERISLFNERVPELFAVPAELIEVGLEWRVFLQRIAPYLGWDETRLERVVANHAEWMAGEAETRIRHHLANGKVFGISCRPLAGGGAILIYDDLTESHRADERKRAAEAEARASEHRFKLLVEGIKDYAIYLLHPDGTVANWNAGAERAKGYTAEEIVGRHFSQFYGAEEQASGLPQRGLETALREGRFEAEGLRYRKDGTSFWAHVLITPIFEEDGSLFGFAKITRDRTEQNRSAERIAHMARYDPLTDLPNRTDFVERLDATLLAAEAAGACVAIANIDLDGFKAINDTHGHAVGDVLLRTLADRMRASLRPGEAVARFGGDEFVAFKLYREQVELDEFIDRLQAELTRPVSLQHIDLVPGASFGIATYPANAIDRDKLLGNADLAMYRAKTSIETKICYYEAQMDEIARERRSLAADIWTALAERRFFLHYQEQRSVSTGEITGYEALLRWNHPVRGLVSPALFIPVAEECGAIVPLGEWVLEEACRQAVASDLPKIAVNLSPLQLNNVSIVGKVQALLLETGLGAHRLELEITESAVIGDRDRALHILRQLKAMGVGIAIDDFGTGYSSLETLRAFPFDRIKLDRSFTEGLDHDPRAIAFVRAMLMLGQSLDLTILAEGVETREQMEFLRTEGCNEVQGFLFGRPALLDEPVGAPSVGAHEPQAA